MAYKDLDKRRQRDKRYYERHKDEVKHRNLAFYHNNKEDIKEKRKLLNLKHRGKNNQREKERYERLRLQILAEYGAKCVCCGENEPLFLELDHVKNNGAIHRKTIGRGSKVLYLEVKKFGFPKDEYQLLCANCNQGKRRNNGICPHKEA